jgi:gluconate kinase
MDRLTDVAQLAGWIPWRFNSCPGRPTVDWCYLGPERFKHPSFDQTVGECLTIPFNLLFGHQTPVELLGQLHQLSPGLTPKGFIFHLSRSGSTLISRMLAALPTNIMISEARPIDSVLRSHERDPSISVDQRIEWLRGMVNSLAQSRRGGEQNLFIRFNAWHIFELPVIRKAFPEVPWIFVYRDPLEVLVSQMDHRGAHMVPGLINPQLFGMNSNLITRIEPEEYCARVLAAILETVLELGARSELLINHQQLPEAVLHSISQHFEVNWTQAEGEIMRSAITRHSDHRGVAEQSDSARKRVKARERLREAAERWVYPVYERVEAKRLETRP